MEFIQKKKGKQSLFSIYNSLCLDIILCAWGFLKVNMFYTEEEQTSFKQPIYIISGKICFSVDPLHWLAQKQTYPRGSGVARAF